MSRDIHCYVEMDAEGSPAFKRPVAFASGEIQVPIDYRLFQALAGLARINDRQPAPLVQPRGLPDPHSEAVTMGYFHAVWYPEDGPNPSREDVLLEDATRWVAEGRSTFVDSALRPKGLVSNPDWHTPGWLLEQEITAALRHVGHSESDLSIEFRATLQLMRVLDRLLSPGCSRLVFWFDN